MTDNFRKRLAILCGISKYNPFMGGNLSNVSCEIDAIEHALNNTLHEGYKYQKVDTYKDSQLDLTDISNTLLLYQQYSELDELLIYFSGHGTIYGKQDG
jgi:hypothetical protein